ncbi:MAG: hypothetical protein IPH12_14515 [Saprospirales bacterium]|nr:hypothetical protein [Saprospirales bacterium]MBK8924013.1 hypothetical protein [Saprospirales bacterium]
MAYPQWYSRLPDERKADFFKGGFDFATEKIRRDIQNGNPFATEPDFLLRFIELTQKEEYSGDVFAFIREQRSAYLSN